MLELITAILAFSAIMILLATLVSVIVETVQKGFRMRRAGLQQMLEALYETAIRDLVGVQLEQGPTEKITDAVKTGASFDAAAASLGLGSDSTIRKSMVSAAREAPHQKEEPTEYVARKVAGAQFAEQLMRNPNFDWIRPRSLFDRVWIWLQRRLVTYDFENIDTRQFIEQLANTDAGDKLTALAEKELKPVLRTIAYQFERYGEAASDYFARRAWVISVFVSIVLAFVVNIDAIRVFRTLVLNPTAAAQIRQSYEALREEQAKQNASPSPQGQQTGDEDKANSTNDEAAGGAGVQTDTASGNTDVKTNENEQTHVKEALERVRVALAKASEQGIPIGRDYFPFCGDPLADKNQCGEAVAPEGKPAAWKFKGVGIFGWIQDEANWLSWIFSHTNGWWWFLSTLLAGALIGLGAPFWYDMYRKAAMVLPVAQVAARFVSAGRKAVTITPQEVATAVTAEVGKDEAALPKALRRSDRATISPDELHDAFMRARSELAGGRPKPTTAKLRAPGRS